VKDVKSFDGDLQMFREAPKTINMEHLRFLRWLVEQGRLEHAVAGPSTGPLAGVLVAEEMSLAEAA